MTLGFIIDLFFLTLGWIDLSKYFRRHSSSMSIDSKDRLCSLIDSVLTSNSSPLILFQVKKIISEKIVFLSLSWIAEPKPEPGAAGPDDSDCYLFVYLSLSDYQMP